MSTVSTATPTEARPQRRRWGALIVLCAGFLMVQLDQTIVNVALPSIQHDVGFSQSNLAWVFNAYLIAFGGLLLFAGRIGDLVGRRELYLAGIVVFTAASLLCGLTDSEGVLIAGRFLQGVGGAMSSAVILGMIVTMFPDPRERARALGIYAFVAAAGASLGLLLGGALTQLINWHWIFFVNLPVGVLTLICAIRLLPRESGLGLRGGADLPGAALLVSCLMIGVYAIVEASSDGWSSAHTLGFGAVAVALMAAFIVRQTTAATPLMNLRVLRSRDVSGANAIQMLLLAGLFGMFFLGALYLQRILGYDPLQVGLALLPFALGIGIMSLGVTGPLISRVGARATLVPGMTLVAVGLFLLRLAGPHAQYLSSLLPAFAILGIGGGLAFPSVFDLAMSTAGEKDSGLISGLVNTSQQIGGALGLAVLASLSAGHTAALRHSGQSSTDALAGGYHLAFLIAALIVLSGAALAAVLLVIQRPAPARPDGSGLTEGRASRGGVTVKAATRK